MKFPPAQLPMPWQMIMHNLPSKLLASLILTGLSGLAALAAKAPFSVESARQSTEWVVNYQQQRLLVYEFDPVKFKPFVKELAPLGGANILRDAPPDHPHHHGLMYAIAVNGLNFWGDTSGNGVQKPVLSPPPELGASPDGLPQATIRQTIHWLAPTDAFLPNSPKNALLIEERTLVLTVNEAAREVALQWKSAFEVGGKTNTVALNATGHNYLGLGMRFLQELDPLAEQFNPDGRPDLTGRKQDLSPHAWSAVSFDRPGAAATIALFDHPSNVRSPALFFTMKQPFAYVSATQALDKEPLVHHSGDHWQVNYLVTIYPELKSPGALSRRGQQWRNSQP